MKLTIDTNVFWDAYGPNRPLHEQKAAAELFSLEGGGQCDLALTSKWTADVPKGEVREILSQQLIAQRSMIPCIGVWDEAIWDVDVWASEEQIEMTVEMFGLVFPDADPGSNASRSRHRDIGHLVGHLLSERDAFVTRTTTCLEPARKFRARSCCNC